MQRDGNVSGRPGRRAAALRRSVRAWVRLVRRDGPLLVIVLSLVALGVGLRVHDLRFPDAFSWDEHHFVNNARAYIHRQHDHNDHPPLGKLLMVPAMLAFGDNGTGWRAAQLAFGLWNIVVAGLLGASLFRDRRAGLLAAAFVAGDGFLIAYSRTALLDGFLTAFTLTAVLLASRARSPLGFAAVGAAIGCAASIKVSGFALGLPAALLCLRARRPIPSIAALGLAPVVYTLQDMLGLAIAREPHSPMDAWRVTARLITAAAGVNDFKHPMTSHWYTWFLPVRPITLRYDPSGLATVRAMTTLGNLVLWWSAALALAWATIAAVVIGVRWLRSGRRAGRLGRLVRSAVLLEAFAVALFLPWVSGVRDSYIYHYLPIYALLLVLLGGLVSRTYRRRRLVGVGFMAAVLLVSVYYAPVWGQLELSVQAYQARLFVPRWR